MYADSTIRYEYTIYQTSDTYCVVVCTLKERFGVSTQYIKHQNKHTKLQHGQQNIRKSFYNLLIQIKSYTVKVSFRRQNLFLPLSARYDGFFTNVVCMCTVIYLKDIVVFDVGCLLLYGFPFLCRRSSNQRHIARLFNRFSNFAVTNR